MITGFSICNKGIATSDGRVCTKPPFLEFLLEYGEGPNMVRDLDASVGSLVKLLRLTEVEGRRLWETERLHLPPYKLTYFPGRFFSIDRGAGWGHGFANFTNAEQYREVLYSKGDSNMVKAAALATEAAQIGGEVQNTLKYLGLPTDKLTSPVAAFKGRLEDLHLATVDDYPQEVAELAYAAVKGNWLEAWTQGYFPECQDWDINACYPHQLSELWDLRRGRWVKHKQPIDQAIYGFAQGYLTTRAKFHPFLLRREGEMTYTPTGHWHTTLTLQEIRTLYDYDLGEFQPEVGWWFIPQGQFHTPYKGLVNWLFEKRNGTSGITREVIHRLSSALWGKTLEMRGEELGEWFNPVVAATVEASTRCKVAKLCLDCGITPLQVAVDGVIVDRPLPLTSSHELGQWRLSHTGQVIIAGPSLVAFEGKHGAEEFSLRFSWLHQQFQDHPRAREYRMTKFSPVTLGYALNTTFRNVGKVMKMSRSVTIGDDSKRLWPQKPRCGADLLRHRWDSEPWDASILMPPEETLDN